MGARSGATSSDVVHDLVVDPGRIGDERLVLLVGEQVADHPHRELGLLGQDVGRFDLLRLLLDRVPLGDQPLQVVGDGLFGGAFGRGAHDHAVLGRLHLLQDRLELLPLLVGEPAADAREVLVGREHEEPPRQGDLGREARTLATHRVLRDLHHDGLARLQHLLDAGRVAFQVLGGIVDLAGVQHAVATAADVDEGRLHARQHVLHPAQVDVAHHGTGAGTGDVVLDQHVFFEHRDLVALASLGDDHDLVGDAGRHDQRLAAAASVSPAGA